MMGSKPKLNKVERRIAGRMIDWILSLPRLARILIAIMFALCVTLALSPLIDLIYTEFFFDPQTVLVPSLVSASFGLGMYVLGWRFLIGTVGEKPDARLFVLWYVVLGLMAIAVVAILIVRGVAILNLVAN
jgi:hypothetical protein